MFQSTPPVWEATRCAVSAASSGRFNPRLPCGRRLCLFLDRYSRLQFQSTPPVWEATAGHIIGCAVVDVSIHASRVGGDIVACGLQAVPRRVFQSTPPVWEATRNVILSGGRHLVSIHASRVGGD